MDHMRKRKIKLPQSLPPSKPGADAQLAWLLCLASTFQACQRSTVNCEATLLSIQVLLADDAEIMRKMIRNLLKEDPEIRLVGEAGNFAEAVRLAHQLKPQIIVMDVHMADESNVTPQDVRSQLGASNARVLAISIWNDEDTKALANSFGAIKLLNKMKLATELIPAIKQCAQGSSEDAFPSLG